METFQVIQPPERVVTNPTIPESLVEDGIDRLPEQQQGEIGQPSLPLLDLAGIPVVVPHIVIQAADDFRVHVLQEDVRPVDTVKILFDTLADSQLMTHRRFAVAATCGVPDIFITPFQPGRRPVDSVLRLRLLIELRRIEEPVGSDRHSLEIGPLVDVLGVGSILRYQIQMQVLPLAETFLVVFQIKAPVPSFQCPFLDFDFHG